MASDNPRPTVKHSLTRSKTLGTVRRFFNRGKNKHRDSTPLPTPPTTATSTGSTPNSSIRLPLPQTEGTIPSDVGTRPTPNDAAFSSGGSTKQMHQRESHPDIIQQASSPLGDSNFHAFLSEVDHAPSRSQVVPPSQLINVENDPQASSVMLSAPSPPGVDPQGGFQHKPTLPVATPLEVGPEAMDVDEVETLAIPQTSSASALALTTPSEKAWDVPEPLVHIDLVDGINGMYRILDLVSEQGSGGLVDKIIISQDSLGCFMNHISPGAHSSMVKVDFGALDGILVNPVGIYGSKSQIVKFLCDINAIDDRIATLLLLPGNDSAGRGVPTLRPGLYFLRSPTHSVVYVIFWPQDSTWDDTAISSVVRNRVTFMRYLTKITDQLVSLISEEHIATIVWNNQTREVPTDLEDDDTDRFFTFRVSKTNEQEENVGVRTGFKIDVPEPLKVDLPNGYEVDQAQFQPQLIAGETVVGYITTQFEESAHERRNFAEEWHEHRLRIFLERSSFRLSEGLTEQAFTHVLDSLSSPAVARAGQPLQELRKVREQAEKQARYEGQERFNKMKKELAQNNTTLVHALQEGLAKFVVSNFSQLDCDKLITKPSNNDIPPKPDLLAHLFQLYPQAQQRWQEMPRQPAFSRISKRQFVRRKEKLLIVERALRQQPEMPETEQKKLLESLLSDDSQLSRVSGAAGFAKNALSYIGIGSSKPADTFRASDTRGNDHTSNEPMNEGTLEDDGAFLARLSAIQGEFPVMGEAIANIIQLAHDHFNELVYKKANDFASQVEKVQTSECEEQIKRESSHFIGEQMRLSRSKFLSAVKDTFITDTDQVFHLEDVQVSSTVWGVGRKYSIRGYSENRTEASINYTVFVFRLTEGDKHAMQLDASWIPSPRVPHNSSFSFKLPLDHQILLVQLLQGDRCLLAVQSAKGEIKIFLDRCATIAGAVERGHARKTLHHDKIGSEFLLTYDETKRMLVVCAIEKYTLYVFIFDERFTSLQALGTPIDLKPWYADGQTKIALATLVCGTSEELVLVDDGGNARVYSFTSQQFRPASIQLQHVPRALYPSPDASCLFVLDEDADGSYLRAYHWSNFGSTDGISLPLSGISTDSLVITSIGSRSKVFFVGLDNLHHSCGSVALDITRRVTEFTFKEEGSRVLHGKAERATAHNSLIDCHADVWTRFPVVPAVRRRTVKSLSGRLPRSITFVSNQNPTMFQSHFANLIDTFERTTRKPTETELSSIQIYGITYGVFMKRSTQGVSAFKAGEWLVDLLCLIPIHIAVTRDNRFIPLKDGVWSAQVERDLLGATVDQIIDGLSFGWYESIFQSYMASKPVKVVSSMGEQSVGKSFALNHLVDTSFAGSAMRTTEGVWMSVTPTDDTLIVALDFEGVHSIERSAQEDSLLVLFNTAMSNLVLFRNNFALSRDITGLFQSFQSSSTVLDPAANPSLFHSTLVIIVKDVVDSDKEEITKEFSLKFQRIVELEQGSNFITMLHAGNLTIIPWPVIESRQFYTLFPRLKKLLDKQTVTHPKAAIFLQTMKTMMAKLKVNDWGSLDQNLASHRAQQLGELLLRAMRYGTLEPGEGSEPLKDFDNGSPIDVPDTSAVFFLSGDGKEHADEQEKHLQDLLSSWEGFGARLDEQEDMWVQGLCDHLDALANNRINYVREWLEANTIRFKSDSAEFEALRRQFDTLSVALRGSIRICKLQCAQCQLLCLQPRHHDGPHNCCTSHTCHHNCQYVDEHSEMAELCGLPAGHKGEHICDISEHLCGQPCVFSGKGGCLGHCSKPFSHSDEEHLCPAPVHECNEPCSLVDIQLPDGSRYSCRDACRIPTNQPHDEHLCDNRSCPLPCQLCKRLCASSNHLHAFEPGAHHLCGQEHACTATCQSKGICKIETTPLSVEATFTGRHETFQYTKYTQVSKHLPCAIPIPAWDLTHSGNHVHSTDKNAFHFCEKRCDYCGYFCTLPLGHTQNEHETSHGSMSRTKWAVDGPDGTIEVNGRKFGSNDDGAPMLCSMVCKSIGRHAHIDFCRSENAQSCSGADIQHISTAMVPDPRKPKDFISHSLYWRRTGFKDPYSAEDRTMFSKCDSMCAGTEHRGDPNTPALPSYCNLPLFHQPLSAGQAPPGGSGYVSRDGHHFNCRNPALMQQAFHVIFVIDRSGSMGIDDQRPQPNTPASNRLLTRHNNRIGSVYQSLYNFWQARDSAVNNTSSGVVNRRDAYTVMLFDHATYTAVENDFTSTPDALLNKVLPYPDGGGTNYARALQFAQTLMEKHWSTERVPVMIFLSDGECGLTDEVMRDLCRRSLALGRPLSFHAVSFGPSNQILRRMADIARDVQKMAPADPMHPTVPSSYTEAIDTIRLAETFLGLAESLRKPRGSLMQG